MTLFIVYDFFSPAYKAGGPVQSLQNLVSYINGYMQVKVICGSYDLDGSKLNVTSDKWVSYKGIPVFYSSKGVSALRNASENSNGIAFINGIYSLRFNLFPAIFFKGRKIISVRGMLHTDALSQKKIKKALYLTFWKCLSLHRKCEYHATSEAEKIEIVKTFGAKTKIWVAPNLPKQLSYCSLPEKKANELILSTVALISPMKNHYLVLEALKSCKARITYHIYGPVKDHAYWQNCLQVIAQLPANINVIYHGDILPEKVEEVLSETHIYIQPSKSENFGHSIFEALSIGRPVITSCNTPWNNLENMKAGLNIIPANTVEISKGIGFFAEMNAAEMMVWSKSAAMYASSSIDIEKIGAQYLAMFGVHHKN